jgi:hypothetical protein
MGKFNIGTDFAHATVPNGNLLPQNFSKHCFSLAVKSFARAHIDSEEAGL